MVLVIDFTFYDCVQSFYLLSLMKFNGKIFKILDVQFNQYNNIRY